MTESLSFLIVSKDGQGMSYQHLCRLGEQGRMLRQGDMDRPQTLPSTEVVPECAAAVMIDTDTEQGVTGIA